MDPVVFVILAILLSGVAMYAVAQPILAKNRPASPAGTSTQEELEELLAQRDAAFQALRELSFDRRLGKITEEDFVQFEAHLKQHAADTLRALDAWEERADDALDSTLEHEIAARRAALVGGLPCSSCGKPVAVTDRFCSSCGEPVAAAVPAHPPAAGDACPQCGARWETGDRFCAKCGQPLAEAVAG
jgi:hypothetical protein